MLHAALQQPPIVTTPATSSRQHITVQQRCSRQHAFRSWCSVMLMGRLSHDHQSCIRQNVKGRRGSGCCRMEEGEEPHLSRRHLHSTILLFDLLLLIKSFLPGD